MGTLLYSPYTPYPTLYPDLPLTGRTGNGVLDIEECVRALTKTSQSSSRRQDLDRATKARAFLSFVWPKYPKYPSSSGPTLEFPPFPK